MTPEQRERFEERAAIREYEGGFTREEAERLAWEDVLEAERAGWTRGIAGPSVLTR